MARSSKVQADATRERIVDTAGTLFRTRGYDAVGIADVMKAAGMTQGGFYKHFASKEALAVEACARSFGKAAAAWQQHGTGAAAFGTLVEQYLSSLPVEYRCPMLAHGEEVGRLPTDSALRATYADGARSLFELFGTIREDRAHGDEGKVLFAAMLGAGLLMRAAGDEEWAIDLIDAVRRSAAPPPPRRGATDPGPAARLRRRAS